MKRLNQASVAAFGVVVAAAFLLSAARAQVNGTPPSVTSPGFGGQSGSIHGTAPSVTSLGPHGYTPNHGSVTSGASLFGTNRGTINGHHPHGHSHPLWGGYYAYPVPYYGYDDSADAEPPAEDQYNGGPTIFDRRGPGTPAYRPPEPTNYAGSDRPSEAPAPEPAPASDQPQTVLIFKDGHQLEVANYAIVGDSLFDLTEGHRHKIALADLDLTATSKQNEDRGIDFRLPSKAEAN